MKYRLFCALTFYLAACQSHEEMCNKITSAMKEEELFFRIIAKDQSGRVSDMEIEDFNNKKIKYIKHFEGFFYKKLFQLCETGDTIIKNSNCLTYCIEKSKVNFSTTYTCSDGMSTGNLEYRIVAK